MRTRDEKKEMAIREKALKLIVDFGFDGFSMHKLAKAAKVSPATIYIYYKNREDLLQKLYEYAQHEFARVSLHNFDSTLSLEKGLWIQWKNRLKFITEYPVHFKFLEQFRNSPLISQEQLKQNEFKESMKQFVTNAIRRGEMQPMDPEIFWSLAYGAFYTLAKFHCTNSSVMGTEFTLTEASLKQLHQLILKSFKP